MSRGPKAWIPLAPPTPASDLGPFTAPPPTLCAPADAACCACPCTATSFVLQSSPCSLCDNALFVDGVGLRLVSAPGWYTLHRSFSRPAATELAVLLVLQVLQDTAVPLLLTTEAPWARVYIDAAAGFSVLVFVGYKASALIQPVANPRRCTARCAVRAYLEVSGGPGCPVLANTPALPCPAGNIGFGCQRPCSAFITGAGTAFPAQVQIAIVDSIVLTNQLPVVLRLTTRPCDSLTPAGADSDLTLVFPTSFPGLTYVLITQGVGGAPPVVEARSMVSLIPYTPTPDSGLALPVAVLPPGASFPVSDAMCSLTLYEVCSTYTAAGASGPAVHGVAAVQWADCDLGEPVPGAGACLPATCPPLLISEAPPAPSLRLGDRPLITLAPSLPRDFGLNASVISVTSVTQLKTQLVDPPSFFVGGAIAEPSLEIVPLQPPGVVPAACPGPLAAAAAPLYPAKLLGLDAAGGVRILLPAGIASPRTVAVGVTQDAPLLVVQCTSGASAQPLVLTVLPLLPLPAVAAFFAASGAPAVGVAFSVTYTVPGGAAGKTGSPTLFAWVPDGSGVGVVTTSCVAFDLANAPTFLLSQTLVLGSHAAETLPYGWWLKPATGDLEGAVQTSGLVAAVTPAGLASCFPVGTYVQATSVADLAAAALPLALLGTYLDGTAPDPYMYVLVGVLAPVASGATVRVKQGALQADQVTVAGDAACTLEAYVTVSAGLAPGTVLLLQVRANSTQAPAVFAASPGDVTWSDFSASISAAVLVNSPAPDWSVQAVDQAQVLVSVSPTVGGVSWVAQAATGWTSQSGTPPPPPAPACGDSLVGEALHAGGAANLLLTGFGTYFHGAAVASSYALLASVSAAASGQWFVDTDPVPSPGSLPAVPQLLQSPGAGSAVVVGLCREIGVLRVALVLTQPVVAGTTLGVTTATWLAQASAAPTPNVRFTLAGGLPAGTVLLADIDLATPASSMLYTVTTPSRVLTPLAVTVVGPTAMEDPYANTGTTGVVTVFSSLGGSSADTPMTSLSVSVDYVVAPPELYTLPPGLVVLNSAMQRTQAAFLKPSVGEAWVVYTGEWLSGTDTLTVFDWSGVGAYVYTAACMSVIPAADFVGRIMLFSDLT